MFSWDGESRCPGGRLRRGNRARCPLSVAGIAMTGTVLAVGGSVTGAVTAVTRGRDPCAGRDRLRSCRDRRGRSLPAESPGQRPGPPPLAAPEPLAHETLACATKVAIAPGGTSSHVRSSCPLLPRLRPCRYARRVSCAAAASRARCACRDSRGRSLPAESPGQRPVPPLLAAPEPLAHEMLACATEVAIALGGTSSHVRLSRPLLPRLRPCRCARHVSCAAVAVGPAVPAVTRRDSPCSL